MLDAVAPFLPNGLEVSALELYLSGFFLSMLRFIGLFAIFPVFTRSQLTGLVRFGIAGAFALAVMPRVLVDLAGVELSIPLLAALVLKEVFIGLVIGLAFGVVFWGVEAAGNALDMQRGASAALLFSPSAGQEVMPTGNLLGLLYATLFMASGAFLLFMGAVFDSFVVWPVQQLLPTLSIDNAVHFLNFLDSIMAFALQFAGPIMIAMFVVELSFAIVTRFAPQLNVFILAIPIKCGIVYSILPLMIYYYYDAFYQDYGDIAGLNGFLKGVLQ